MKNIFAFLLLLNLPLYPMEFVTKKQNNHRKNDAITIVNTETNRPCPRLTDSGPFWNESDSISIDLKKKSVRKLLAEKWSMIKRHYKNL